MVMMVSELHLQLIEPKGVDEEDGIEDDVATNAEEDKRFPGVSVGERPSKEGDNNCWYTLESSIKGLDTNEVMLATYPTTLKNLSLTIF